MRCSTCSPRARRRALSIEPIAAKAGVGKATIYRRWAGKNELLIDAVKTLKASRADWPGESVRDDLVTLHRRDAHQAHGPLGKVTACLMPQWPSASELHRVYQGVIEPRRERCGRSLRRGIADGELRAGPSTSSSTLLMLSGPTRWRRTSCGWNPASA